MGKKSNADARVREELAAWSKRLQDRGLVIGPGGNTSARCGDVMYVKPSGLAFEECQPDDYVGVSLQTGEVVFGERKPTCEVAMHLLCYKTREDVGAVVHTHPPIATGVASAGIDLSPMYPDFVALLGTVPVIPYIVPAGVDLAEAVAEVMKTHDAALMSNHGVITVGSTMREAVYRTELVEDACKSLVTAMTVGTPRLLTKDEIDAIGSLEAEDYRKALLKKDKR